MDDQITRIIGSRSGLPGAFDERIVSGVALFVEHRGAQDRTVVVDDHEALSVCDVALDDGTVGIPQLPLIDAEIGDAGPRLLDDLEGGVDVPRLWSV